MMNEPKPGVKTTEWWTTIATMVATVLMLFCPPEILEKVNHGAAWVGLIGMHVSNAAYTLSRGIAKKG